MSPATKPIAVLVGLSAALGCSSDSSPATDAGTGAPVEAGPRCPKIDTTGPVVSFADDVVPLFAASCAFRGCHDGTSRTKGLYLGPSADEPPLDAAILGQIHDSVLSPARTTLDIPRVTPFEPSRSFLLLKVAGCQNLSGLTCTGFPSAPCGAQMPDLSTPLAADKIALLARWIAQGATGS